MSPLQYQKQLRLLAAGERMLIEELNAASAAFEVGYERPSQFNREYKRVFGQPPCVTSEPVGSRSPQHFAISSCQLRPTQYQSTRLQS